MCDIVIFSHENALAVDGVLLLANINFPLFIYLFIHLFFCAQGTQFPRAEKLRKE